jgi:hypothetical protein
MASYLLLRNNKESGPHSVDDLRQLGLKPYDLVWVQGKSAAWRYPSEIDDLKSFAPIVEEQPYDRFYKKPSTETKEEYTPPVREPQPIQKEELPTIKPEHEKYIPKGSVFVTMPGQKTSTGNFTPAKQQQPVPEPKKELYTEQVPEQTIVVSENPAAAQIKYSQPLDEIKEMYVKTLHDRKQKIARKGFWLQSLKKAAVILSLVAVGVIAGLIINSNSNKSAQVAAEQTHLAKLPKNRTDRCSTCPSSTQKNYIPR